MIHSVHQVRVSRKLDHILTIPIAWYVSFSLPIHLEPSIYLQKVLALSIATRSGAASCTATGIYLSSGTVCCQTDLCNGASANYQTPVFLAVSIITILAKSIYV
jgi:hypothetical protein